MKNKILYFSILFLAIAFTYACSKGSSDSSPSNSTGTGGSLARFAIVNDRLYSVNNLSLKVFNISDSSNINETADVNIGWNIETLSPGDSCLYIGSQIGMYVYDIKNPDNPFQKIHLEHIYSCDPVVSDGKYAYVTLSSTSFCGHYTNELQVYDISEQNMGLVKTVTLYGPKGLGLNDSVLYVCDDKLKVFNVKNPKSPILVNSINISAKDVIPIKNTLIVVAENKLTQYKIDKFNLLPISTISAKTK